MRTLPNPCSKKELLKTISWSYFAFCAPTSSLGLCLHHQIQELLYGWDNQFVLTSRRAPATPHCGFEGLQETGGLLQAGTLLARERDQSIRDCLKTHISHTLDRSRVTHILWEDNL